MRISINRPELLEDLVESLRRCSCDVEPVSERTLDVGSPSRLLTEEQARNEVAFYLAAWQIRHPPVRVTIEE
jgi:hypothetical protein